MSCVTSTGQWRTSSSRANVPNFGLSVRLTVAGKTEITKGGRQVDAHRFAQPGDRRGSTSDTTLTQMLEAGGGDNGGCQVTAQMFSIYFLIRGLGKITRHERRRTINAQRPTVVIGSRDSTMITKRGRIRLTGRSPRHTIDGSHRNRSPQCRLEALTRARKCVFITIFCAEAQWVNDIRTPGLSTLSQTTLRLPCRVPPGTWFRAPIYRGS